MARRLLTRNGLLAAGPPLAAALVGGVGSRHAPAVYARIRKPRWAPPAGAFGPVWTVLYVMIGCAGWRLRTRQSPSAVEALHVVQLLLNALWPWTFFEVRDRRTALVVIAGLDATVAAEVLLLLRRDGRAAGLLLPYLWSLYATALTAAVSEPG